ncbi:hypothetical protein RQP46_008807 [Phenoliferia psychrophenolica]
METLPHELLAHILHLSNEGESAQQAQRNLIAFRLVARAFFLAVAESTSFYVGSEKQAKALIAKLEGEKKWAAQEERKASSGRTTRSTLSITRVSNVRRISIKVEKKSSWKVLVKLLLATPEIVALQLDFDRHVIDGISASLSALEVALGGLKDLRKLEFLKAEAIPPDALLRILIPLKGLETLDLLKMYPARFGGVTFDESLLPKVVLPRLRTLFEAVPGTGAPGSMFGPSLHRLQILKALAIGSATGVQVLDLGSTRTEVFRTGIDTLAPLVANLTHFRHSPHLPTVLDENWDAWLKLIGTMTHLKSFTVSLHFMRPSATTFHLLDQSLFDTLATLPILQSVSLAISGAKVDDQIITSYISSHPSLKDLSFLLEKATGLSDRGESLKARWTQEQQDRVQAAAEVAGVVFMYNGKK